MATAKDLMMFAGLILALFVVGISVGVSYLGFGYLKESVCEQQRNASDEAYTWVNNGCTSDGSTAATVTAITKIGIVEAAVDIALGLIALVVLMLIFKVVIKTARGFSNQSM